MLVVNSFYPPKKDEASNHKTSEKKRSVYRAKHLVFKRTNNLEFLQPPETWRPEVQPYTLKYVILVYKLPPPKVTKLRCNTEQLFNWGANMAKCNQLVPSSQSHNCTSKSDQYKKCLGLPTVNKILECLVSFFPTRMSFHEPISRIIDRRESSPKQVSPTSECFGNQGIYVPEFSSLQNCS